METSLGRAARFAAAVGGRDVRPLVTAVTFLPDSALPGDSRRDPSERLAAACDAVGADVAFVPALQPWAEDAVAELSRRGLGAVWVVEGPLWPVLHDFGFAEALRLTVRDPRALAAALDGAAERAVRFAARGQEIGAAAVAVADDLAGHSGPIVAPDFALDELFPRMASIVTAAGALPSVFHSDGDVRPLLSAAARAGFRAFHGGGGHSADAFERLYRAGRKAGLTVIGGIDTAELVLPKAIAAGSRAGLTARAGDLIVADDGGISRPGELTALASALEAARDAAG